MQQRRPVCHRVCNIQADRCFLDSLQQLLRRCHPELSCIPNSLFYGGQLQDGCTAEQRGSLVPGLPPLCFLDVQGQEQHHRGSGSISNPQEASVVAAAIQQLLSAPHIFPTDIGVICFYRKQVSMTFVWSLLCAAGQLIIGSALQSRMPMSRCALMPSGWPCADALQLWSHILSVQPSC